MYTGTADHSLTAELVELVDVPVIASGDITSRARAQAVLATTGADGGDGRPRRAGQPVGARARSWAPTTEPSREEVVAELLLFIRETVRELGEHRATGFLKKFYALVPRPRPLPEAVQAGARDAADDRGGRDCASSRPRPGAAEVLERLEAELPPVDEVLLDSLPISAYGGG